MTTADEYEALVDEAVAPFRSAGRLAYGFARGKLLGDPVFKAIISRGLLPRAGTLVDLGSGQGVLEALLVAAAARHARGAWPRNWPAPPAPTLIGVDLRREGVRRAQAALGARAHFEVGDIRAFRIPSCRAIVILDVLHYVSATEQQRILEQCRAALEPDGVLLLRVGDAAAGARFWITRWGDQLITMMRGNLAPRFHCRSARQWTALLQQLGFHVRAESMSLGTPFANILLRAGT